MSLVSCVCVCVCVCARARDSLPLFPSPLPFLWCSRPLLPLFICACRVSGIAALVAGVFLAPVVYYLCLRAGIGWSLAQRGVGSVGSGGGSSSNHSNLVCRCSEGRWGTRLWGQTGDGVSKGGFLSRMPRFGGMQLQVRETLRDRWLAVRSLFRFSKR
jgi:hypothetical protein